MTDQPTPSTTVSPETVSATLHDPDSPYYPAQIGVVCDGCGTTVEHDYLVRDDMDQEQRFGVVREYLRKARGWRCDANGDLCPRCAEPDNDCPGAEDCPVCDVDGTGDLCERHEREDSHADGDHELCGDECPKVPALRRAAAIARIYE